MFICYPTWTNSHLHVTICYGQGSTKSDLYTYQEYMGKENLIRKSGSSVVNKVEITPGHKQKRVVLVSISTNIHLGHPTIWLRYWLEDYVINESIMWLGDNLLRWLTACGSNLCQNGGWCMHNMGSDRFTCRCRSGYAGRFCKKSELLIGRVPRLLTPITVPV